MSSAYTLETLYAAFPGGIRIPRIQRGYVQGRDDAKGEEIRKNFVPALVTAVFDSIPLSLDFVYGVADGGCLMPLDGQQRLTTLFLLAWLCGKWQPGWHFNYESRRIPQLFVKGLVEHPRKATSSPSTEIRESGWFLPCWEEDPTVSGMLTMLGAMNAAIGDRKPEEADFGRTTFLLHGIDGSSETFDHIFRKMNARGKELSPWENMKAMLDKHLPKPLAKEWCDKVDGDWAETIWKHSGGSIAALDNSMEKIVRMAYARFAGAEAQGDSLWEMEARLCGKTMEESRMVFTPGTAEAFYRTTAGYFDIMASIAPCWTKDRSANALWNGASEGSDFWGWLANGQDASVADQLRMAFLSVQEECHEAWRRRRVLLNLLDNSNGINAGNFARALSVGLDFLAGRLDVCGIKDQRAGYSPEQLSDEERKWNLDAERIVGFEKNDLAHLGSLRFIGWSDFKDEDDIKSRLARVKAGIDEDWIRFFCNILVRLERGGENELKYRVAIPYDDYRRWREFVLPANQVVKAIAEMETGMPKPEYTDWLRHFEELARRNQLGSNYGLRAFDGWTYVVADVSRSQYSIRLDCNDVERENRQKLADEIIRYENGESRWAPRLSKVAGIRYNVWDKSWYTTKNPPPAPPVVVTMADAK